MRFEKRFEPGSGWNLGDGRNNSPEIPEFFLSLGNIRERERIPAVFQLEVQGLPALFLFPDTHLQSFPIAFAGKSFGSSIKSRNVYK